MHLQKVSTHVRLKLFAIFKFFAGQRTILNHDFDKMDFMDLQLGECLLGVKDHRDASSPLFANVVLSITKQTCALTPLPDDKF